MKELARRLWSLWFAFWLIGYFVCMLPVYGLVLWRLTPRTIRWGHQLNRWWGQLILFMGGIRIRYQGYHFPEIPCILVSNHRSYLDIPICYVSFPPRVAFLGKAELARIPLYGWTYRRLHVVVDRNDFSARKKSFFAIAQKIRQGLSVLIYPEGTTKHPHPLGRFYDGAFALAIELQVPLLPFVIIGSDRCLSADGRFLMQPGQVLCVFHPLIFPQGETVESLKQKVYQWMLEELSKYENHTIYSGEIV
ncbi:MAG: lysophospholipid acyltransferase family protein [Bacteroidia bacterium]|nr:1-acyl-sn-glycerol-3-phosphate acyltransferase [Bacteroidia bacterium]MDW8016069.1 lysophospholipid acyltransferase family protein [Bacteroidia bacterium]